MSTRRRNLVLSLTSGILLGIAYPPVPTGITALFGFIPFLIVLKNIEGYGKVFRYSYVMLFVFNAITLYWAGGFVHGKDLYMMSAGALLLVGHPLIYFIPIFFWEFIRRRLGFNKALYALPFIWVAFEYFHSMTQMSFPWIILGNTQTYDLALIQFSSYTGVYGVSFLILCLNVIGFVLYSNIIEEKWRRKPFSVIFPGMIMIMLYILPKVVGLFLLENKTFPDNQEYVKVAIIQPNIDPFKKWQESGENQMEVLKTLTATLKDKEVDLVVWPETAIPFYMLHPANKLYFESIKQLVDSLEINLLTGVPDIIYYEDEPKVPPGSKKNESGQRYDNYNSSILLQHEVDTVQKYAKINLVPFAEHVPYSEFLNILNAAQWNFGLGGWSIGRDSTVFRLTTKQSREVRFSNFICYESVFPGFVASFVRNGAQFLTVITNDSWWGNTSGAYQHQQIAVMRAIENRRWVVHCANGGISCFIDPMGNAHQVTDLYTRKVAIANIELNENLTFYSKHGDWFAQGCMIAFLFLSVASYGSSFYKRYRENFSSY